MKPACKAFTLIELVIAITIMAIIGVIAFVNYKPFGEDQNLKSAVLDTQSLLKTAQTNATTNTICNGQASSTWKVQFSNNTSIKLQCQPPGGAQSSTIKTLTLGTNIQIQSVSGVPSLSCPSAPSFTISFTPLKSQANFADYPNCTSLEVNLKNTKTGSTKSFIIEKGGRIYAP